MTEIPPRLSKQQKFILADLWSWEKELKEFIEETRGFRPDYAIPHSYQSVSRDVAKEFNKENKDRVFNRKKIADNTIKQGEAAMVNKAERPSTTDLKVANLLNMLATSRSHKEKVLWGSHSQSVSRAVKRLEERGLVHRLYEDIKTENTTYRIPKEPGNQKTRKITLTDKGREVAQEIKCRVEDGRYSLEFETL